MKLSEGVRGLQSCGSNTVINKLLEDNWTMRLFAKMMQESTYGGGAVSKVSGGCVVLSSGF